MKHKRDLKPFIAIFIAMNLAGFAVALFLKAGLGSDPITVFIDGIHDLLNVSYGTGSRIYNVVFLVLAFGLARKNIGWTTVVYALLVGFLIDFYDQLIPSAWISVNLAMQWFTVGCAQIMFGFCFALMIRYRQGMNQVDALSTWIVEKTKWNFVLIRTVFDVAFVLVGWLLGGVIGLGTIIASLTTGLCIRFALTLMKLIDPKPIS